jgi:hypothetical protein
VGGDRAGQGLVAHHDDGCVASGHGDRLLRHGCPLLIDQEKGRPAVVQQMGHLGCDQAEVEGYGDGPEAHDAAQCFDVFGPIGHEDSHTPAYRDPEAGERRGNLVETCVEIPIRDAAAIRPQSDLVRLDVGMPPHEAGPRDGIGRQQFQLVTILMVMHVHGVYSPGADSHAAPRSPVLTDR